MPENADVAAASGSTALRRAEIYKRLQHTVEQCKLNYSGRKELACEKDDTIAELCEAFEDAFNYGLRQQQTLSSSRMLQNASNLLQNMQEIVTGNAGISNINTANNESTFWEFCQLHLTPHERERFQQLKCVWTAYGRGRAFIRAALNENSLQRYLLTWLSATADLQLYYTHWSLLLQKDIAAELPDLVGQLNNVLFALTVDSSELNVPARNVNNSLLAKTEPIIYAPTPKPPQAAANKVKRIAVERPIATANSVEDLLKALRNLNSIEAKPVLNQPETVTLLKAPTPDPIEPELAFLNEPLPNTISSSSAPQLEKQIDTTQLLDEQLAAESETSSQSSKVSSNSSSRDNATIALLQQKLQDMSEQYALLETRVAQLSLENRQLLRRLTQCFKDSGIDPSSSLTNNYLITIPNVQLLKGKRGSSYYAYEVHITMRQRLEHWSVLRRYRDFYKLHKSLLRTHPAVNNVEFPPKKRFGNMNARFVEERRQQLQIYLLNLVETLPQVEACKSKLELQRVFPFLRERSI